MNVAIGGRLRAPVEPGADDGGECESALSGLSPFPVLALMLERALDEVVAVAPLRRPDVCAERGLVGEPSDERATGRRNWNGSATARAGRARTSSWTSARAALSASTTSSTSSSSSSSASSSSVSASSSGTARGPGCRSP
jgi:hypothetical protein